MADDLKRYLYKQLQSVEGLHAIVVTDRDGVPVIKVANDNTPVHALRPGFLSTFALATDQGSKLGLSKNKSIICYYNSYQTIDRKRLLCPVKDCTVQPVTPCHQFHCRQQCQHRSYYEFGEGVGSTNK